MRSRKHGFNLNIPRYIDSAEPEDLQDIDAHLNGGIPERDIDGLERYWRECPALRDALFESAGRPGYLFLKMEAAQVKPAILSHPEFVSFRERAAERFAAWRGRHEGALKRIRVDDHPKLLIETLSEDLLAEFAQVPLLDKYDVYQGLMTYWTETMQDDVYLIVVDGWTNPVELIPRELIVARYFAEEQAEVETLTAAHEETKRQVEEMAEEHGGEGGLLEEAVNDKGQLTLALVKKRRADLLLELGLARPKKGQESLLDPETAGADEETVAEWRQLVAALELLEAEGEAKRKAKAGQDALDKAVTAKYAALTEEDIKVLVVEDKWLASLEESVRSEMDRISQALTGRIRTLADRYADPLPRLTCEVEVLAARVDEHLKRMGAAWK